MNDASRELFSEKWNGLSPGLEQLHFCGSSERVLHTVLELSKKRTGRSRILVLEPTSPSALMTALASHGDSNVISGGDASLLCRAIAESAERIGAVAVQPEFGDPRQRRFLRRVRDLASAEGALMICDESVIGSRILTTGCMHVFYGVTPDVVCLRSNDDSDSHWLAGRSEIFELY